LGFTKTEKSNSKHKIKTITDFVIDIDVNNNI